MNVEIFNGRPFRILCGDALATLRTMPAASIHCCVTSPPYWGLRDYGADGQIGLERTPEEYVAKLVEVFREVRRVLRDDGTLWLNLGDCYATGAGKVGEHPGGGAQGARWKGETASRGDHGRPATNGRGEPQARVGRRSGHEGKHEYANHVGPMTQPNRLPLPGLKPKDLVGVPWMVAFALRADGWYLRSDVIWAKPNPMPESVTDRPTKAHEYLFLLSKSERYFYDAAAVRERAVSEAPAGNGFAGRQGGSERVGPQSGGEGSGERWADVGGSRNRRSVWTVTTQPFAEAHFATMPPALVEPCIQAGTSERGCCASCGAPWARTMEIDGVVSDRGTRRKQAATMRRIGATSAFATGENVERRTVGWAPSCNCPNGGGNSAPAVVLDPFNGAGTTGLVATRLQRRYVGIELNQEYIAMSERRIVGDAPLFNSGVA